MAAIHIHTTRLDADGDDERMGVIASAPQKGKRWYCAPCRCAWRWVAWLVGAALLVALLVVVIVEWELIRGLPQKAATSAEALVTAVFQTTSAGTGSLRQCTFGAAAAAADAWAAFASTPPPVVGLVAMLTPLGAVATDLAFTAADLTTATTVGLLVVRDRRGLVPPANWTTLDAPDWTHATMSVGAASPTAAAAQLLLPGCTLCLVVMDRATRARVLATVCGLVY